MGITGIHGHLRAWLVLLACIVGLAGASSPATAAPGRSSTSRPSQSSTRRGHDRAGADDGPTARGKRTRSGASDPDDDRPSSKEARRDRERYEHERTLPHGGKLRALRPLPDAVHTAERPATPPTMQAVVLMPMPGSSDGFRKVFGSDPTAAQQGELDRAVAKLRDDGATLLTESQGLDELVEVVSAAARRHERVAIVAHVERGTDDAHLVLPDGSRIRRDDLIERVPHADLVFLTCYSRDLDPNGAITLEEAYAVYQYARAPYLVEPEPTLAGAGTDSGLADDAGLAQRKGRLNRFIAFADEKIQAHPRVALSYTTIDEGDGRWLVERERERRIPGRGWLVAAPNVAGHLLLVLVMLILPRTGEPEPSSAPRGAWRRALGTTLRRRRKAIAVSGAALVVLGSLGASALVWLSLEKAGELGYVDAAVIARAVVGMFHVGLAHAVARVTPFGSRLGRVWHGLAGGLAGLSGALVGSIPAALVVAFLVYVLTVMGFVPKRDMVPMMAVLLGMVFVGLCVVAGRAAMRGESPFVVLTRCMRWFRRAGREATVGAPPHAGPGAPAPGTLQAVVLMPSFRAVFGHEPPTRGPSRQLDHGPPELRSRDAILLAESQGCAQVVEAVRVAALHHARVLVVAHVESSHGDVAMILPDGTRIRRYDLLAWVPVVELVFLFRERACVRQDADGVFRYATVPPSLVPVWGPSALDPGRPEAHHVPAAFGP
jgi:hypothetical protein